MKKSKFNELAKNIKEKTNIDFEKYNTQDLKNKIIAMLSFIQYATKLILVPPLVLSAIILASGIWFLNIDKNLFLTIIYMFLGFLLTQFTGLSFGLTSFLKKIKSDTLNIFHLTIDIATDILNDIKDLKEKPPIDEVVKGILLLLIMPTTVSLIKKKVIFIGGITSNLVEKTFLTISKNIKITDEDISNSETINNDSDKTIKKLEKIKEKSTDIANKTLMTLLIPFNILDTVLTVISIIVLGALLLIIL